ncbi:hypothetical protein [Hymenobacter nivis]|uniref:hypothetical protein n=1 Tax=Hymenobacter nivis TaxID=1850093 RepID=UPI0013A597FC|nr:hypothetical protein [Hymenobacter nivis]
MPVTRGVSEDGYPKIHLPAAETGRPLRFVTEGAYSLLGKLKNAKEEEYPPVRPAASFPAFPLIFTSICPTLHPTTSTRS